MVVVSNNNNNNNNQRKSALRKSKNPSIEVVIARYNENPFAELLPLIPDHYKITIYNKGDSPVIIPSNDKHVVNIVKLKNVGREAHTYLHHIISVYHKGITDITLFLMGSCLDTSALYRKREKMLLTLEKLSQGHATSFFPFARLFDIDNPEFNQFQIEQYTSTSVQNRTKNPTSELQLCNIRPFGAWFRKVFPDNPRPGVVSYNGIFAVSKEHIKQRPHAKYVELISYVQQSPNHEAAHYLERSWTSIFYPFPSECVHMAPLPKLKGRG